MTKELNELLRLNMETHSIYGICKDVSKEEFERRIDACKKYIEARNKFVKEQNK